MTWAPDYIEPDELKGYASIQANADDAFVALWITTVSRNIDDFTGRQFGQVDSLEERFYTPKYDRHEQAWFADIDDVQDITGMTVSDDAGTALSSYTLLPRNAATKGKPYERIRLTTCTGELALEAKWGWTAVPSSVKVGILLQGNRLKARRNSPFGIAGSPTEGNEVRLLAQLDPDFKTSLKPYVRRWWAA